MGLVLGMTATALESLSVAIAMPAAVRELGGLSLYGFAFSAFFLTMTIGMALGGSLADLRGPQWPFGLGSVIFSLGLVLAGKAGAMSDIVIARALQGLGAGLVNSATYACVGLYFAQSRPTMLAVLSSAWAVPALVGPGLAGLVTDNFGWRWVFWGLTPAALLAAGLVLTTPRRPMIDVGEGVIHAALLRFTLTLALGTSLVTGSFALLAQGHPWAMLVTLAGLGLGALATGRLLRARQGGTFALILAITFIVNLSFFGIDALLPMLLIVARDEHRILVSGGALTAAAVGWVICAWWQARFVEGIGRRGLVGGGCALILAGIAGVTANLWPVPPTVTIIAAWGVAGMGMGLAINTLSLLAMEHAAPARQGEDVAAIQLSGVIGMALSTGLGGAFLGTADSPGTLAHESLVIFCVVLAALLIPVGAAARYLPVASPGPCSAPDRLTKAALK